MSARNKSKTAAAWLALGFGSLGLHRFYVNGLKDKWGWLHPLPTLLGLYGLQRMDQLGQDDRLAWVLIPWFGLSLAMAMLNGIVWGLQSDEAWNLAHNQGRDASSGNWLTILAVVGCLMVGGAALMSTIAFSAQRYFESQMNPNESAH